MGKTVLVVASHADDEVLGCGGTIARLVSEGDKVHLVLMADGVHSRAASTQADLDERLAAASKAHEILGISSVSYLELPDNKMDSKPLLEVVQALEPIIRKISPSLILTHHHGDLNIDHQITQRAVMTACRPQPGCSVKAIYGFEVLSSTEWTVPEKDPFLPNLFVDISAHLNAKLRALEAYSQEMREVPHSRSIQHAEVLARHRGFCMGMEAAEAFVVYRIIH